MKQDVSSNEIVDELKKKVLELYDVIDKQNDLIVKYQKALNKASIYFGTSVTCDDCIFFRNGACNTQHDCFAFFTKQLKEKVGIE